MPYLPVEPLGKIQKALDWLMIPVMHLLMFFQVGSFYESPQQTHRWNNRKLNSRQTQMLSEDYMVHRHGVHGSMSSPSLLRHIPGTGWKHYAVLEPRYANVSLWYVGWVEPNGNGGVSRISVKRQVRMLVGKDKVRFFGISPSGFQIPLKEVGRGVLGKNSEYFHVPLL